MTSDGSGTLAAAPTPARTTHRIDERSITVQCVIDAPRDLVFLGWTDPIHVARWWGPRGFRGVVRQMEVAVGGRFRICTVGPDGTEYPIKGTYEDVVEPQRLVYVDDWDDERPSQPSRVNVLFAEHGPEQTVLSVRIAFASQAEREAAQARGIVAGWGESFERLDAYLAER
ncbi:SRPBCC domain-containing protein [Lysobacter capsici]|uniref:SRPBCC domain-containing protein n=1 Tax=Lysobacter capsici TaxID=435897 RepID=UPI001C004E52|nr:SRPBCC domain-containing protein [Lysobacter capsici]QWF17791.1 SRPBCC domain-containing protein [Lysobacter capsici]